MSKPKHGITQYMTTVFAVGAAVLLATTGAGSAAAQGQDKRYADIAKCEGLSPHIIDVPHMSDLHVSQEATKPGTVDVSVSSALDIWGYRSHPTITWVNLATGASGTLSGQSYLISIVSALGVSYKDVPTGSGPVRFDLSVVNNEGIFPVPPITCTGSFDVH